MKYSPAMTSSGPFSKIKVALATLLLVVVNAASALPPVATDGIELFNIQNKQGDFLLMLRVLDPASPSARRLFAALGFKSEPTHSRIGIIGNSHDSKVYLMQGGEIATAEDSEGHVFVKHAQAYIRNSFELTPQSSYVMLRWEPSKISSQLVYNETYLPKNLAEQFKGIYKCADLEIKMSRFFTTSSESAQENVDRILNGKVRVERLDQIRHSLNVYVDPKHEMIFHVSEASYTEPNPTANRDVRIHMRHMGKAGPIEITKNAHFNERKSIYDSMYFYITLSEDMVFVVPLEENADTYAHLPRSYLFFQESLGQDYDQSDDPSFQPDSPFIFNRSTGETRNVLPAKLNPVGSREAFPNTGRFILATGKGAALRLFDPGPELPPNMTRLQDIEGVRVFEWTNPDGSKLQFSEGPIPGYLDICETNLIGKKR